MQGQVVARGTRRRVFVALLSMVASLLVVPAVAAAPAVADPVATLPAPRVIPSTVVAGDAVTISGSDCVDTQAGASTRVYVSLVSPTGAVLASGVPALGSDGSWIMQFTVPASTPGGVADVAVTCDRYQDQLAYPAAPLTVTAAATRWAASTPVLPTVPDGDFAAVSCPTTTACTAVGSARDSGSATRALAAVWDGRTWTRQAVPGDRGLAAVSCVGTSFCAATAGNQVYVRKGARWTVTSPGGGDSDGFVGGVSCTSPTACTVVGGTSGWTTSTVAYRWDGTTWTPQSVPTPAGLYYSALTAVSCVASSCLAVGNGYGGAGSTRLVATWNGSSWSTSVDPTPLPAGATSGSLDAVSCATATTCVVVGSVYGPGGAGPLVERWSSGRWKSEAVPAATAPLLRDVACTSAAVCTAVGTATDDDAAAPYVVTRGQDGWQRVAVPSPTGVGLQVEGVACPAATACAVVGRSGGAPLVLRRSGADWAVEPTLVPVGNDGTRLNGVSCASTTSCVAVGRLDTPAGVQALAETWNGSRWSVTAVPDTGRLFTELEDVACSSAVSCVAVGGSADQGNVSDSYRPVAFTWDGTAWTQVPLTLPSGARTGHLQAVSCSGAGSCLAVGGNDYDSLPLAYALTADGAVARTAAVPNGLRSFQLSAVSCVARGGCVALGTGRDQNWADAPRSLVFSGSTWSRAVTAPAVDALSCSSVRACVAVGHDQYRGSDFGYTQVTRWDGSAWNQVTVPDPGNGTQRAFLTAVSCPTASSCTAVGAADQPYVSRTTNGTQWTLEAVTGLGSGRTTFRDVSCPTAASCVAVGSTDNRAVAQVRSAR